MPARYSPRSIKRLNRKLRSLPRIATRPVTKAVRRGALRIQADAMTSIREPGTGRLYTTRFFTDPSGVVRPITGKKGKRPKHRASAPGKPPASDSGRLLGSVEVDIRDNGFKALIGTALDYGRFLEFGTKKMEARPWLNPAFKRNIRRIETNIAKQINIVFKKAGVRVT